MAAVNPSTWSEDPDTNTSIENGYGGNLGIEENCAPSVINNSIRSVMAGVAALGVTEAQQNVMNWMGEWQEGTYAKSSVVNDEGWLMVSNADTDERAGIFGSGAPFDIYTGTISTAQVTAKQVIFGSRYTVTTESGFLTAYRLYQVAGNYYTIYSVEDPTGTPIASQLSSFTADSTGWTTRYINNGILRTGLVFDVVAVVTEPDPTPTIVVGNWDYSKPQNDTIPLTGQITQSGKSPALLWIHKTDNDATDRSGLLTTLSVGDIIEMGSTRWSVQANTDLTTYHEIVVAPALQDPALGVQAFTFTTTTATPITYGIDTGYWSTSQYTVQGLYGADVEYSSIVPTNDAMGIDVTVQAAAIPTDWDVMAVPNSSSSGGAASTSGSGAEVRLNSFKTSYELDKFSTSNLPAPVVGGLISVPDDPAGPALLHGNGQQWERTITAKGGGGPGWGFFDDSVNDTANRQSMTGGTRYLYTSDGLGSQSNTDHLDTLDSSVWTTNAITPEAVGESYSVRIGAKIVPTVPTTGGFVDIELDIGELGVSQIIIMSRRFSLDRGNGVIHAMSAGFPIFCLSTFFANGGRFYLNPSIDCDVYDRDIFLARIYSP